MHSLGKIHLGHSCTKYIQLFLCTFALFFLFGAHTALAATTTVTFTANGTWTVPANVYSISVEAWGGGGGSGGSNGATGGGGGGAGGAYARTQVNVVPGTTYTVVAGAGGTAGTATGGGGTGKDSMFFSSTTLLAKGGGGGGAGTNGTAGATSSGSIGTTIFQGGNGSTGVAATRSGAGGGGAGDAAVGTAAVTTTAGSGGSAGGGNGATGRTTDGVGTAGNNLGGGASGGYRTGGVNRAGAAGARGQVNISYTPSYPLITQEGYIFENDDNTNTNDADANTQQARASTSITSVKKGERIDMRFQIKNTGSTTLQAPLGLFYDRNDGIWTKVKQNGVASTSVGNCTDTNWECETIETTNVDGDSSLAVDASGNLWMSYVAGGYLYVARHVGSGGVGCSNSTAWTCTSIYTSGNIQYRSSIAIASGSTTPWISYFDYTAGDLLVARYVGSGGTGCVDTTWTCTSVDTNNSVGENPSIAFPSGSTTPWISYYDFTNTALRVAQYVGSGGSGCASSAWKCTTVDSANDVGWYSGIAFDASGTPWVGFDDTLSALRVARYVGSGGTGCASAAWTCTSLPSGEGVFPSVAFDPSGNAWVSMGGDFGSNALSVARYVGSGGTGCSDAAWTCTSIDDGGDWSGYPVVNTIAFDPGGNAWISYVDTNLHLSRLARYVGSGGTGCSDTVVWTCTTIKDSLGVGQSSSLVFDPSGNAWMSYTQTTTVLGIAKIARAGEIVTSPSLAISIGTSTYLTATSTRESHADMTTVTDTTNRDDADCVTSGATWSNGTVFQSEEGSLLTALPAGPATPTCTEVSFTIDTSQATQGQTYRFALATKDALRPDKGFWRGTISGASSTFPTFTIETATSTRISKDTQFFSNGTCTNANWSCWEIDPGSYNSLAFDPAGNAWLSYYDNNTQLRIAHYVGIGHSAEVGCSGSGWNCGVIDATNDVGSYTFLAFDHSGNPWVSYYDATNLYLRVARYVGSGGTGCASTAWTCTAVDTTNDVGSYYTSLAFDSVGNAWVSYYDNTNGNLRVAHYVGSGGTGCASAAWTCTAVETTNNVGDYSSLAFDPSGNAWVSYYDQTNSDLRVAHYVGSGGSGCADAAWTCTAVDTTNIVGFNTSLAFDPAGNAWVSYLDNTNGKLRVARYVGSGGTGCADATWTCTAVDTLDGIGVFSASLAFDSVGNAWVSYYDNINFDLRVARYVGSGGSGCVSAAWTCVAVDTTNDVGSYTSIAFDLSGTPWVIYRDNTNSKLRIAKLSLPPNKLSATSSIAYSGRSAGHGDLRYRLDLGKSPRTDADGTCSSNTDKKGYCAMTADDTHYDQMAAYAYEYPVFAAAFRNGNNSDSPTVTWVGKSSAAPSSIYDRLKMQIYRFGSTNAWVDMASTTNTCTTTGANTDCTIVGATSTNVGEYYNAEGTDYWVNVRIYQDSSDGGLLTLKVDRLTFDPPASPNLTLTHYRWREDNGAQSAATYSAAEDTPLTSANNIYRGDRKRLRMLVNNAGSADGTNITYRLEYASSSCTSWLAVPSYNTQTSQEWVMDLSQWVPDGAVTTNSSGLTDPGGQSFVAGQSRLLSNQSTALTLTSTQFTELEYALRSTSIAQTNLLYCFRLTNAGSITNFTYTVQPQMTLNPNARPQTGGGGIDTTGSGSSHTGGSSGGGSGTEGSGSGGSHSGGGSGGGGGDMG